MTPACTILLVDDDPALIAVFAMVLQRGGYSVLTAGSAGQALELLSSHTVSAIITDLHMPTLEGAGLLAQVAAGKNPIPGILITGSGELEEQYTNAPGVSAILIKPIVNRVLLRTLERVLAKKKGGESSPPK
ncbi:MAG TPA: response regulator [Acidobacteriaceae bacterium]|nr:response regulator [Acidobacteriaceae bacterium]